ncbi:MAG: flagellar hook protein FlgE, partial [Gammaproteobacteria bacterium]|nr:flagellar hook protein FlgE [Gammaproteobacteria bacterium]
LSGLAASQRDLDTSSNNIANVNTTGFKGSRAEFADVYASSLFTNSRTKVGDGVQTSRVAQQFSQGTLDFTENALDLAIKGNGFFVTAPEPGSQDLSYTRAGAFKLDRNSFIVDNSGSFLQAYPVNRETGQTSSTALSTTRAIEIPSTAGQPSATQKLFQAVNLDSRELPIQIASTTTPPGEPVTYAPDAVSTFDPADPTTYTDSTSATVYDSLGEAHTVTTYYVKRDANTWDVYQTVDGQLVDFNPSGTGSSGVGARSAEIGGETFRGMRIGFNAGGNPSTPLGENSGTFLPGVFEFTPSNGSNPLNIEFNFRSQGGADRPTQFASAFELTSLDQDGSTVGRLTGVDINEKGLIAATYSNGQTQFLGQVAMVNFNNEQGLEQVGGTKWKANINSGEPITGIAGQGTLGAIESSALENSNVNLTEELVDIIVAQRNYQANSRALEVNSTLQQTILQIR